MDERGWLTERFEAQRPRLRGLAYRMLGSLSEAEDAVQEAWLRLQRSDATAVDNLGGWLTTVVSRVCLDLLRARKSRREEPMDVQAIEPRADGVDPEDEAVLADAVGVALLVVLDTLTPAERLAFVLHDLLAMPFDEIGAITGRSPAAVRQLASRARRRVRGSSETDAGKARQREVVEAFLRAARAGDLEALLAVLDPDAVIRIDAAARIDAPPSEVGLPREIRGASRWAAQFLAISRGHGLVAPVLVDGALGLVIAPPGGRARVVTFTVAHSTVTRVDVIGDPARLRALEVALL